MRLLLVDGTNVVMRYKSAMVPGDIPPDHPSIVEQLPKILGAVERVIRECAMVTGSSHVVVAIDSADSWRKAEYPDYKGKRLQSTTIWSNRLNIYLEERGIFCVRSLGFEADDIIATLVARAAKAGHFSVVFSGDSDLLMLASLFCHVYQFGRGDEPRLVKRDTEWVRAKYQISTVADLPSYKALVGDPSDNLPGVPGVGAVKARTILASGMTAWSYFATAGQLAQYKLMLRLVTLREDADVEPIEPGRCRL